MKTFTSRLVNALVQEVNLNGHGWEARGLGWYVGVCVTVYVSVCMGVYVGVYVGVRPRAACAPNKGFARRQQEFIGQEVGCMSGGMEV